MPPIVVFDTNILFSAIGWRGRPYECIEYARQDIITGVTCQELLDELTDKLRVKLAVTDEQLAETLADLLGFLSLVAIANTLHGISPDPDVVTADICYRLVVTKASQSLAPPISLRRSRQYASRR